MWGAGWWCGSLVWKQARSRFLWKAEEVSDSLSTCGRAFQSLGAEMEKTLKLNCFSYGCHPHLQYKGKTEMIDKIAVVHSKESDLEDTVDLCHWSSCAPLKEFCDQYNPSQEVNGGFPRWAWCALSSPSVSQSLLLCSAQVADGAVLLKVMHTQQH